MKQLNLKNFQTNLRKKFLKSGVKMIGPETIFFSKDTKIGKNVTIEPYVVIGSNVKIGNNVTIKSFSHLEKCKIENKVDVGPYARIRPGTILKEGSKIGNFVEIKKSTLGKKSLYFLEIDSSKNLKIVKIINTGERIRDIIYDELTNSYFIYQENASTPKIVRISKIN